MLPIHQAKALEKLGIGSESYQIVKARFEGRKFADTDFKVVVLWVYHVIDESIKYLGHYQVAENSKTVQHLAESIIKIINIRFKDLTLEEFKIILNYMVHEKYKKKGELLAVSVKNMENAIVAYKTDVTVRGAFTLFHENIGKPEPEKPLTHEQKIAIRNRYSNDAFAEYKKTGVMPLANTATDLIYRHLKAVFNIKWSAQEYEEIEKMALENMKKNLVPRYNNKQERNIYNSILDGINNKKGSEFEAECRRAALTLFFKKAKLSNVELFKPIQ
jgi:hypothetical protein